MDFENVKFVFVEKTEVSMPAVKYLIELDEKHKGVVSMGFQNERDFIDDNKDVLIECAEKKFIHHLEGEYIRYGISDKGKLLLAQYRNGGNGFCYAKFAALEAAAQDFVENVETGRAKSTDSYNKFKLALSIK
jgi:hypothetical protein